MSEHATIKTITDAKGWGKILSNRNRVKMLMELSKSPLSKGKIADLLGVTYPTVNNYVTDLVNLGIAMEYSTIKDGYQIHIVKLKNAGVILTFKNMEEGWNDE